MEKVCLSCGEKLIGRSDKKFCSDSCRNNYHHSQHGAQTNFMRNINNILRRNRAILSSLNPNGKISLRKSMLDKAGFNFRYFTHTYTTKEGKVYYFVYDQGYVKLEGDYFALVCNTDI
ncbi:MAG: hypothetical protein KKD74_01255 [Bacteroidetes bacterium]|nr:hypothetical protein [Bacteroidota bacterium]